MLSHTVILQESKSIDFSTIYVFFYLTTEKNHPVKLFLDIFFFNIFPFSATLCHCLISLSCYPFFFFRFFLSFIFLSFFLPFFLFSFFLSYSLHPFVLSTFFFRFLFLFFLSIILSPNFIHWSNLLAIRPISKERRCCHRDRIAAHV